MPRGGCHESEAVEWIEGLVAQRCPVADMTDLWAAFQAWQWLDHRGVMPVAGGWADQSPIWIEMMEIIAARQPVRKQG